MPTMESKGMTCPDGTKYWYNSKGQYHRTDGPACEYSDGAKEWFLVGNEYKDERTFKVAADIFIALFPDLRNPT